MKQFLCATAFVALAVTGAAAADMPLKAPPQAPAPAAFDWSGFYIGGQVGYAVVNVDSTAFNGAGVLQDITHSDRKGFYGGGQIGFNFMVAPHWVAGVEADIAAANLRGSLTPCTATGCAHSEIKIDEIGSLRGRFGYAFDRALLYATGGVLFDHSSTNRTVVCVVAGGGTCPGGPSPSPLTGMTATASGSQAGWTAGGGVEWAVAPHWTVKAEYLHFHIDNIVRDFSYPGFPGAFRHIISTANGDTVRLGVNYLFNWGPTVVAKY
jgi:outer membrane immunogenic protein